MFSILNPHTALPEQVSGVKYCCSGISPPQVCSITEDVKISFHLGVDHGVWMRELEGDAGSGKRAGRLPGTF